ncbi:MAG: RNA polymerase subunit sigma [Verrucomicrobia bacterium]|nr:MAG: RNA polymerase subunit sigma [Verrucomicrobiota bacterium]
MDPETSTTTLRGHLAPTRYSLLSRLEDWGDDESWRVFFDTYWRLIYSVALKAGLTAAEAEDVVQETIIGVAQNIHKFKRDRRLGSFKGWLCHLTRWRIADQFEKRTGLLRGDAGGEGRKYLPLEAIPDVVDDAGAQEWEREWHAHLLKAATQCVKQRVKEEQYQLFDLYVVKHWPVSRIRQTLGVSATQVYLAKHRITRLLQKEVRRLEKEWEAR